MSYLLSRIIWAMPIIFGAFFLGPLIAELMVLFERTPESFGITTSPLIFGMAIGGAYGIFARITGRWI